MISTTVSSSTKTARIAKDIQEVSSSYIMYFCYNIEIYRQNRRKARQSESERSVRDDEANCSFGEVTISDEPVQ